MASGLAWNTFVLPVSQCPAARLPDLQQIQRQLGILSASAGLSETLPCVDALLKTMKYDACLVPPVSPLQKYFGG